jgi:hypothetical protein
MGFFHFDSDNSDGRVEVSAQGWIYLALAIPLTFAVLGLSFAWMRWTGSNEEKPHDYPTKEALAHDANTMRPGAGLQTQPVRRELFDPFKVVSLTPQVTWSFI